MVRKGGKEKEAGAAAGIQSGCYCVLRRRAGAATRAEAERAEAERAEAERLAEKSAAGKRVAEKRAAGKRAPPPPHIVVGAFLQRFRTCLMTALSTLEDSTLEVPVASQGVAVGVMRPCRICVDESSVKNRSGPLRRYSLWRRQEVDH